MRYYIRWIFGVSKNDTGYHLLVLLLDECIVWITKIISITAVIFISFFGIKDGKDISCKSVNNIGGTPPTHHRVFTAELSIYRGGTSNHTRCPIPPQMRGEFQWDRRSRETICWRETCWILRQQGDYGRESWSKLQSKDSAKNPGLMSSRGILHGHVK